MLLDVTKDIAIAQRLREGVASDTSNRTSIGDVAAELEIDLDQL